MGLFDKLFSSKEKNSVESTVDNLDIVAIADGTMIDIAEVNDELFSQKLMGDGVAFRFNQDKVTLCSPANGTLTVLFPTGHAYGVTMQDGVELLVHCGINTVEADGDGFKLLKKKQGYTVKAGDPIVEVDVKKLAQKYDMSTMLIITNPNNRSISFGDFGLYTKGQSIIK